MRKLQRNTNFEGAHDQLYRADSKNSPALSEFLSLITELQPETPTLPRYLQASSLLNRGPIIGTHIKKINDNLLTTQAFIDEYTKSGTVYHGTSLENVSSIIRGGFVISGIGQGRAALGSGLYTTKNRDFALSYGDIIFPLRIDQEKHLKIIDLKTITTALLKQLEDEASNKHFFDINELLKIAYHVDIIIKNNCAIIQNANVVEKILAHDLLEATGSAFQNKWMEYISLDNKLVPLIKYDDSSSYYKDNYHKIHDDFERYTLLHLLSGEFENDRVSPSTIIKQLTKTVKTIEETTENTQLDIKTKITKLFIYEHCDLAESSYVFQNLREIIKGTLTNNAAPTASAKKTEE
ncbi:MAG TPA: hypothetical protein VGU44_03125, partial [Gammaproteobacteria bacterium]|nr:hypothetical protein [Gammaproteobacteria bacterium]